MRNQSIKFIILTICSLTTACNTKNKEKMTEECTIEIFPKGEKLSNEWFTGNAFLYPFVARDNNNDFSAGNVTFEKKSRTVWHTHPKGQVLIVIDGNGFYQEKGKPAKAIKKGDIVNVPENTEHWHEASATSKMVHINITNFKDDKQVTWLQPVSEEEYNEVNKNQLNNIK